MASDGSGFTVAGPSGTGSFGNVQELQFSDVTEIVAAAPSTSGVTSGNVTEIYAAVFDRLLDVPGLAYYENVMKGNAAIPITNYAEWFLQSPEYVNDPAHDYAQSAAGAELPPHATVLADFSASPEFLGDVQVTAQHPASASHRLLLI